MKILLVHNRYQIAGGEDAVFLNEMNLLKQNGHIVETFEVHNKTVKNIFLKILVFLQTVFSITYFIKFSSKLREFKPDVVHVHNYFPIISPSVFFACKALNVPVVHTLHNFRAICPTSFLMIEGEITEKSLESSPWWALRKRVYKNSYLGTFVLCLMISVHKMLNTWNTKVDAFICLTEFSRKKFIEAGWKANKLITKPNFVEEIQLPYPSGGRVDYAIFVGRLSEEKGIKFLLDAWQHINLTLYIIGEGPEQNLVQSCKHSNIKYLGKKNKSETIQLIKGAQFLVMSSKWYEGFPMVLVEAFSQGTCALVPNIGGMAELVTPNETGMHFLHGNKSSFIDKASYLISHPDVTEKLGCNARDTYKEKYTAPKNYQILLNIYKSVIELKRKSESFTKTQRVLSMNVNVTQLDRVVNDVIKMRENNRSAYICVSNVHMCIATLDSMSFREVVNTADIVIPDGRPIYWAQKLLGCKNATQVRGMDIMNSLCSISGDRNLNIGFYGGSNIDLTKKVASNLTLRYPDIRITFTYSPPFRALANHEKKYVINAIRDANVDILFVGIGCPKQEIWMAEYKSKINCVMLGVGAAFDFIAGTKKVAPDWMQKVGLEWFYRLCSDPRRLAKRYLTTNPRFIWYFFLQLFFKKEF